MVDQKQLQSQHYRDAAFRIFVLLASRRLNGDVLLRDHPKRRPVMRGVTNAFQPWAAGPVK